MAIPTPAEVGKLLKAADDHFTAFVALCGFAGMRLGEAAALRVGDIRFLAKEIRIERQVQRANGGARRDSGTEIRIGAYRIRA